MKKLIRILVLLIFVQPLPGVAQPKRICVMGSSTAYGYFPGTFIPRDSSWAFKIKEHFKATGQIDTLYNIATPGIDCYIGMPTGYVPPPGRNFPNPEFNITRAVNFDPKPDVIIINFPSNNYTVLSIPEIISCLQAMKDYANAQNIRCYITTTQPRNDFVQLVERQKLKDIKQAIEATFGVFSIDFWTDLVQEPSLLLNPAYNLGDGVHLTPGGHTLLKNRLIARDIFFAPVAIRDGTLTATGRGSHVLISWNPGDNSSFTPYRLQRATAGGSFATIHTFQQQDMPGSPMIYVDNGAAPGINLYRVSGSNAGGGTEFSSTVAVRHDPITVSNPYLFPTVASSFFNLMLPPGSSEILVTVSDMSGKVVWKRKFPPGSGWKNVTVPSFSLNTGLYRVHFPCTRFPALTVIKR